MPSGALTFRERTAEARFTYWRKVRQVDNGFNSACRAFEKDERDNVAVANDIYTPMARLITIIWSPRKLSTRVATR